MKIDLVSDYSGRKESRYRPYQGNSPINAALLSENLKQAFEQHVEEIRVVAFMEKDESGRQSLQQGGLEQVIEALGRHFRE